MDYSYIKTLLSKKNNIVITSHKTPDGDALGSSLALFHAFKKLKNVTVIMPNQYPNYLKWLPGSKDVIIYEGNELYSNKLIACADIIFCLDFNKLYRTHTMSSVLKDSDAYKIMIDHHEDPDDFCEQVLLDTSICSTAELIFDFLQNLSFDFNRDIAICLYTGITTDSGSFRYPNVTQKTHEKIAYLMSFNINHASIHENLFDSQNKSRIDLLKVFLKNLKLYPKAKSSITFLLQSDLISCQFQKGDTEGFVNLPMSIKDVKFSTFFVEFEDGVKFSFRSQGDFDVNLFAKKYFNGGGHKNAAGGFLENRDVNYVLSYFEKVLLKFNSEF